MSTPISQRGIELVEGSVVIRSLRRADAEEIERWPHFTEPDLLWANYHFRSKQDKDLWYKFSVEDPAQVRLAITRPDTGAVIGLVGLRHINAQSGNATLGIRMSPNVVGRGLGSDSVRAILRYGFTALGLRRIYLDVAEGNHRARRCYEKVGFSYIGRRVQRDGDVMLDMRITAHEFQTHEQARTVAVTR